MLHKQSGSLRRAVIECSVLGEVPLNVGGGKVTLQEKGVEHGLQLASNAKDRTLFKGCGAAPGIRLAEKGEGGRGGDWVTRVDKGSKVEGGKLQSSFRHRQAIAATPGLISARASTTPLLARRASSGSGAGNRLPVGSGTIKRRTSTGGASTASTTAPMAAHPPPHPPSRCESETGASMPGRAGSTASMTPVRNAFAFAASTAQQSGKRGASLGAGRGGRGGRGGREGAASASEGRKALAAGEKVAGEAEGWVREGSGGAAKRLGDGVGQGWSEGGEGGEGGEGNERKGDAANVDGGRNSPVNGKDTRVTTPVEGSMTAGGGASEGRKDPKGLRKGDGGARRGDQDVRVQTGVGGGKGRAAWGRVASIVKSGAVTQGSEEKPKIRYPCRDMRGRVHDADVLRKRRIKAIGKGMAYLYKFFRKKNYAALYEVGDDAPSIFFEIWYTCGNSSIRSRAKDMAVHLTTKLQARMLSPPNRAPHGDVGKQRDEFFAVMFMLRAEHEMGMDTGPLLQAADEAYERNKYSVTRLMYGVSQENLGKVSTASWLELVVRILIVDYNNMLYPKRWPTTFGLKDAMAVLREHRLSGPPMDPNMHFQDSFYLATHIIYATSAYSGVKTFESDMPWLYKYIRRSFSFWMTQARLKLKDPGVYVDVDGVGEALDNLRGTGLTEVTDSMVCEGTVWLLDTQLKNGSWPVWFDGGDDDDSHDSYDLMHSTWVCTQALRDRDFKINEDNVRQWRVHIEKILKEVGMGECGWKGKDVIVGEGKGKGKGRRRRGGLEELGDE